MGRVSPSADKLKTLTRRPEDGAPRTNKMIKKRKLFDPEGEDESHLHEPSQNLH